MHKKNNIINEKKCCGCGICAIACPHHAITIRINNHLSYRPVINETICSNCGICIKVCSVSSVNLKERAQKAVESDGYYGFASSDYYLQGSEEDYSSYMKSASGGLLSALLNYLLENKKIDAILHAGSCSENGENPLAICTISRTSDEIDQKRGSFYGPIEFSSSLSTINDDPKTKHIAIVCTPCAASALNLLKKTIPRTAKKIRYVFALMCGHNANGKHGLMMINGFPELLPPRKLNMREKEELFRKDSFNISAESGNKKVIKSIEVRFKPLWRGFWNAELACLSCPDFSGADADASFKDAWRLEPVKYKKGESAVVVRNPEIKQFLREMTSKKQIVIHEISRESLVTSQWTTIKERYYNALNITESKNGHSILKIGYMGCRVLKRISIALSQRMSPSNGIKLQLYISAIIGKFLSGFARFTNERK